MYLDFNNIVGSNIDLTSGVTRTLPNISIPKNISLFTVDNIIGNIPNYQIIISMPANYINKFSVTCNGITKLINPPMGSTTYTFDTNITVLQDLSASIRMISGGASSAYIKIPKIMMEDIKYE